MVENFYLETLWSMLNESIYHYLFRPINLIHNACLLLNFLKKVYKEIPKGNSILANGHMFEHSYYY